MKTLGFERSKSITLEFWTHQDQQSCAGWHMVRWLQDSSRASKLVLVQVLGHQGQQTRGGAHKIQSNIFGGGKWRGLIPGGILKDNKLQLLQFYNSNTN